MTVAVGSDVLSELLITQLLEEDLRAISYQDEAERLQLEEVMRVQGLTGNPTPRDAVDPPTSDDAHFALNMQMKDAMAASDALYAQSLQLSDASAVANMQYAQKVAAMEKSIALDAEFARRLQALDAHQNIGTADTKDAVEYAYIPSSVVVG